MKSSQYGVIKICDKTTFLGNEYLFPYNWDYVDNTRSHEIVNFNKYLIVFDKFLEFFWSSDLPVNLHACLKTTYSKT